jgi:hypothetical protein
MRMSQSVGRFNVLSLRRSDREEAVDSLLLRLRLLALQRGEKDVDFSALIKQLTGYIAPPAAVGDGSTRVSTRASAEKEQKSVTRGSSAAVDLQHIFILLIR